MAPRRLCRRIHCVGGSTMGRRASNLGGTGRIRNCGSWSTRKCWQFADLVTHLLPGSHTERDRLAIYRSMRDAAKTPEPVPAEPPDQRPRAFDL